MPQKRIKSPLKIRKYAIYSAILWTLFIAVLLQFDIRLIKREALNRAYTFTKVGFDKDVIYRRWAAEHGGIYVKADSLTPPNPYLSHIPDRDILIDSTLQFTLMNPAYMTRQVYELEKAISDVRGHITSLNALRPENAPDEWERTVLEEFENGITEVAEVSLIEGKEYFRFMRPFITEESCLKCHAHQGYKVDDIRGGVSVSYPMSQIHILYAGDIRNHSLSYIIIWFLGLGIIVVSYLRLKKSDKKRLVAEIALKTLNNELEGKVKKRTMLLQNEIEVRKTSEKKLVESEEKFRALYNNSPDMYVSVSPKDASILQCNITLLKNTGYSREEVIGAPIFKMYHNDCMDEVKEAFQQFVETGEVSGKELILKTKTGNKIEVSLSVNSVKDEAGEILYSISSWRDITERKKAEKKLMESEERYQYLFKSMTEMFQILELIYDTNGNVIDYYYLDVNPAFEQLVAKTRDQIIGNRAKDLFGVVEDSWIQAYQKVDESGVSTSIENYGAELDKYYSATIWKVFERKVAVVFSDITERKKTEEELKKYRENLETIVKERTKEIETKNKELERINRLFIGRELRMKEMKEEIKNLKSKN